MKKNIIDEISLLMMGTAGAQVDNISVSDEQMIEKIMTLDDIDLHGAVDGRTLLIHASFYNRKKVVEYLLELGANLQLKDNVGFTALHAAVNSSNREIARLLLSNGADVNEKDSFGNVPMFRATHTDIDIIKLLLEFGADVTIENNFGISPKLKFSAYPDIINLFNEQ